VRLALAIPLVAVCFVWSSREVVAQVPLTYTITALASDGTQGTVTFQGVANGVQLTGTVQGQDVQLQVVGTIGTNGSVSGTLSQDGVKRGVFWGGPNGLRFWGSFDLGGKVGNWSAAGPRLPVPIGP
jgi:hypothetical protein